jgi:single-strand DNA-binding protein
MSLNRIVLIGRLTRDPEMRYTPQGVAVATMRIAVDRFSKNDQGEYETDFFDVVAWRRSAEFASNYLKKGRLISVEGRLQSRTWVDQPTGQKRTAYEIVADNIQGLDKRSDAEPSSDTEMGGAQDGRGGAQARPAPVRQPAGAPAVEDIDESDPFADE